MILDLFIYIIQFYINQNTFLPGFIIRKESTSFDENQQAAIDAALANAGLAQGDVTDIDCTLDEATQQYTVTFTFQDIKNICMVDAATFTVLSSAQS